MSLWPQLYLVPTIGSLLFIGILISPYKALKQIHASQKLGPFDPVPYAWMIVNNVTWFAYIPEMNLPGSGFVFFCHWAGLITSLVVFRLTLHLASAKTNQTIFNVLLGLVVIFLPFVFIIKAAVDPDICARILSICAILGQVSFFGSPLIQLGTIIKSKSAESISFPLAITCIITTALWTVFGFAINEFAIYIPNILSLALSIFQISLYLVFRNTSSKTKELLATSPDSSVHHSAELQTRESLPPVQQIPTVGGSSDV
jgi:solute carrier family 50 protein (sugar transporter)